MYRHLLIVGLVAWALSCPAQATSFTSLPHADHLFVPPSIHDITPARAAEECYQFLSDRSIHHIGQWNGLVGRVFVSHYDGRHHPLGTALLAPGVNLDKYNAMAWVFQQHDLDPNPAPLVRVVCVKMTARRGCCTTPPFTVLTLLSSPTPPRTSHATQTQALAAGGQCYAVLVFLAYCRFRKLSPDFSLVVPLSLFPPTLEGFLACVWNPLNASCMLGENQLWGFTKAGTTFGRLDLAQKLRLLRAWLLSFLDNSYRRHATGRLRLSSGRSQLAKGLLLMHDWLPGTSSPATFLTKLTDGHPQFDGLTIADIKGLQARMTALQSKNPQVGRYKTVQGRAVQVPP